MKFIRATIYNSQSHLGAPLGSKIIVCVRPTYYRLDRPSGVRVVVFIPADDNEKTREMELIRKIRRHKLLIKVFAYKIRERPYIFTNLAAIILPVLSSL